MEKRVVLFLVLSMTIVIGYSVAVRPLVPAPKRPDPVAAVEKAEKGAIPADAAQPPVPATETPQESAAPDAPAQAAAPAVAHQRGVLGSYRGPHPFLITWNNAGASIECIELTERLPSGELRYRNLDDQGGYLGYLGLTREEAGVRVNVVAPETPAAAAGMAVGDVISTLDGAPTRYIADIRKLLAARKPGTVIQLELLRAGEKRSVSATLDVAPLELIHPEIRPGDDDEINYAKSWTMGLVDANRHELADWRGLAGAAWQVAAVDPSAASVEFRWDAPQAKLAVVKRFRLGTAADLSPNNGLPPYHVHLEIEVQNQSDAPRDLALKLNGPTSLPLEGWWYSTKIHPEMFHSAGARDVMIKTTGRQLFKGGPELYSEARKNLDSTGISLVNEKESVDKRTLEFCAVDTQYFASALLPRLGGEKYSSVFASADAVTVGDLTAVPKARSRTVDVSFVIFGEPERLAPQQVYRQQYTIFAGPKETDLLAAYGLHDVIEYGWFKWIAQFLALILHASYGIFGNYGIAIVTLTVLVRSCMFPISRTAAKNAAMMQLLAPEMKAIAEKYKTDMEKRGRAQQDLFRKYNYNPFSGCWLMFLQLPVFMGLYRCLSVDIRLRQAPLIPGLEWCNNLAGPDKLWNWENSFSLFSETGMLGPYLNILPLFTVALFLVHQKLFTPPATDEQTQMQLTMMKYMTLFMGVLFFKVPAGLCLYFIVSSLWSIGERKLIPQPKVKLAETEAKEPSRGLVERTLRNLLTKADDPAPRRDVRKDRRRR